MFLICKHTWKGQPEKEDLIWKAFCLLDVWKLSLHLNMHLNKLHVIKLSRCKHKGTWGGSKQRRKDGDHFPSRTPASRLLPVDGLYVLVVNCHLCFLCHLYVLVVKCHLCQLYILVDMCHLGICQLISFPPSSNQLLAVNFPVGKLSLSSWQLI